MKILFIGPLPEPVTGQSLACQVLVEALRKDHALDIVDLNKGGFVQGVGSLARIRAVLKIVWSIWRRRDASDVIYFTISESIAGNAKDLLIYLCCLPRLRHMAIHLHGGAGLRVIMGGKPAGLARINAFFFRRLGAAIVLGARHVDLFSKHMDPARIKLVPNFAQDYVFVDRAAIDAKFSATKPMVFLFLSNLIPGKGHLELVDALSRFEPAERDGIEVHFAGGFESPQDQSRFLDLIRNMPMVTYHGKVGGKEKQALLARAHVLCLPTYYPYEGQPICILEAYASGCAVITTDHSGIFDTFTPGINGYAVEKRSAASLKGAMERALLNPADVHAMAIRNSEEADAKYRTSIHTGALCRIIEELA